MKNYYDVVTGTLHGIITMRCKAFSYEGIRYNRISIEGHDVRVWDDVAGHYTSCHILSIRQIARARQMLSASIR